MNAQSLRLAGSACVLSLLIGCASPQLDRRPLFDQLGGKPGIERIVNRFVRELVSDPAISDHFEGVDLKLFRDRLVEQFCELGEGPCTYSGDLMVEVHRNMEISQGDFNALVEDLIRAMEAERVPTPVQNRLLVLLAPMRGDVIQ